MQVDKGVAEALPGIGDNEQLKAGWIMNFKHGLGKWQRVALTALTLELVHMYSMRLHQAELELAARREEAVGFQVGLQVDERYKKERQRFDDHLEAIKFICNDFWMVVFKKQIDSLKTNHRPSGFKLSLALFARGGNARSEYLKLFRCQSEWLRDAQLLEKRSLYIA
ncbi:hypothetical protein R1sor_002686 [Riccia sorocarpa]|uniref:Trafficking protein particle complex subunit 6B n=1 Tax=Riccia sorocarpa TaxID=122646 RepID=A0ABD3H5K4_9MARC